MVQSSTIELGEKFDVEKDWEEMNLYEDSTIQIVKEYSIRGTHFVVANSDGEELDIPLYEFKFAERNNIITSVF